MVVRCLVPCLWRLLTAADHKVGIAKANPVVRLAIVTIMTKPRVACLLEAASLATVEAKMVNGPLPLLLIWVVEAKMVKGPLPLLLIRVVLP